LGTTKNGLFSSTFGSQGFLSAAAIRLILDFESHSEAMEFEARLVRGHMRIVYSVQRGSEHLETGTPSEPILAEAAARILNDSDPNTSENRLLKSVCHALSSGLVKKEGYRTLVARMLLTLAHDKCIKHPPSTPAPYSQPVTLLDFLEALIGKEHWTKIREARPNDVSGGETLEEAFKDAKVNFTHFAKGADEGVISDCAAWAGPSDYSGWKNID